MKIRILSKSASWIGILVAVVMGLTVSSCSNSSDPTPASTETAVAFEHATMKPWFDTYCASCHASGKSNYRDWLYDPTNYTSSIKGNIAKIYSEVYVLKSMPEGTKLSSADLATFKTWYDAGYAAK
ncbi:MAG: hypothetical protein U0Y10_11960 [Spirosomataceae bacterium]